MKDLIKVANELQKVMDFEEGGPPVDGTEKELTKWVEEAVDEIDYEIDKFTDDTTRILIDMQLWRGPTLDEDEDEDNPEVEVVEEVEEVDNLVDQIKAAGQMKDLKNTCKDLDEFKSIRGQLSKYKSMKELREVMLGMLEDEKEKKPEPKAKEEKKPVEKKTSVVKPAVKKGSAGAEKIAFFTPLIEKGKFTKAELVEKGVEQFPHLTVSTLQTFLTDAKNPKYSKFDPLVIQDANGIMSFKK